MRLFPISRKIAATGLRGYVRIAGRMFGLPAGILQAVGQVTHWLDPVKTDASHPFLSDEWLDETRRIRESYRGRNSVVPPILRVNQVINEVPFGSSIVHAHLDTTSGDVEFDLGHVDEPDLTVTTSYEVAKALIVDADMNAAMQAFMSGAVTVDGDIMKLMALSAMPVDPLALEASEKIRAITT